MNITGAIFDFDGTLFDSMHVWKGVRYKFFDRIGIVLSEEDEIAFKGLYLRESIILAKERFNRPETYEEHFSKFFELIKEMYLADTEPKNDIIEFLEKLRAKGIKSRLRKHIRRRLMFNGSKPENLRAFPPFPRWWRTGQHPHRRKRGRPPTGWRR